MVVTLKGNPIDLEGSFLNAGDLAPNFVLCSVDLETKTLSDFEGKRKVLATMPSVDTEVCSLESIEINKLALKYPSVLFIVITKDLPFAQNRFCKAAQLENIITLSDIRPKSNFSKNYGVKITSGPLEGLIARSILFLDESDKVLYSELCSEVTSTPNFDILKNVIEGEV
ncbi:MAG: thiol peroxidase [Gammaproteobacteria bacterium]|nr:Thiol peroxidase [Chlamydiia bacterium]MCH9690380.1 thiol peroxidase [Gammaproteobacteria bacterium]